MSFLCPRVCDNKNEFGYCRTTWCINPQYSNIGTAQYGQGVQKAVVTNADCIRAMSDEELAERLANFETRCYLRLNPLADCNTKNFTKQILGWLKSPVEEGEE